jgi:hypothetical protein
MTEREREKLRQAIQLLWRNEGDDFGDGMRILTKLAGMKVPAYEVVEHAAPISILDLARQKEI